MRAAYCHYRLDFLQPAITSRSVMRCKDTYFIKLWQEHSPAIYGIGECALFKGLSHDDRPGYEARLDALCAAINRGEDVDPVTLGDWSSMVFGYGMAIRDLANGGLRRPYPSDWSLGQSEIVINGLIWMGNADEMLARIKRKLDDGFRCVKLKIGGVDFDEELALLRYIRTRFSPDVLELRVDANGAFAPADALRKLDALSTFTIHSIEQPIKAGQWDEMRAICERSPIPVALDEELIGLTTESERERMLNAIQPAYIILKPSLCGGFEASDWWIRKAESNGIGWWATSALESNIGLNAIAQWVSCHEPDMPQGLGTGMLYSNNIASPLSQVRDVLRYDVDGKWIMPDLPWIEP